MPLAIWLAQDGAEDIVQGQNSVLAWYYKVDLTSLILSMAVNALVTGLIVVKILKVFLEVKANVTSVEQTLNLGSTGGTKLRHVIFIIIESGMALFAIQLIRVVVFYFALPLQWSVQSNIVTLDLVMISINQMFNVIIKSVHFYFSFFTDNIYLARASHQH